MKSWFFFIIILNKIVKITLAQGKVYPPRGRSGVGNTRIPPIYDPVEKGRSISTLFKLCPINIEKSWEREGYSTLHLVKKLDTVYCTPGIPVRVVDQPIIAKAMYFL